MTSDSDKFPRETHSGSTIHITEVRSTTMRGIIVLLAALSLAVNVAHGWSRIRHDCGVAGHIGTCDVGEEPWGTVVDSCSCHNMFLGPCQLRGAIQ